MTHVRGLICPTPGVLATGDALRNAKHLIRWKFQANLMCKRQATWGMSDPNGSGHHLRSEPRRGHRHLIQCLFKFYRQRGSFIGQGDLTVHPVEQTRAEMLFQRLDLVADGGLGDRQFVGRLLEAQVTCGRLEGPQMLQVGQASGHGFALEKLIDTMNSCRLSSIHAACQRWSANL